MLASFRKPKAACFLTYVENRPKTNTLMLWKTGHAKGGHIREGEGKRRKLRKWK
jgi:hypothetical protein